MLRTFLLASLLAAAGCSKSEPSSPPTAAGSAPAARDPAAARRLIAAGAVVLDVRTTEEYATGHLPEAQNVPLDQIGARIAEIGDRVGNDRTKPIVVYCAVGSRAAKAKRLLDDAGYTNVVNGGGLDDLR